MADFYRISEPEGKRLFYKELLFSYCFCFQYWERSLWIKAQSIADDFAILRDKKLNYYTLSFKLWALGFKLPALRIFGNAFFSRSPILRHSFTSTE